MRPTLHISIFVCLILLAASCSSPPPSGAIKENPKDGLRYVWIPAGGMEGGCSKFDNACATDEQPAHAVTITQGFWIAQTETTVAAYRRFVTATGRAMPPESEFGGRAMNPKWAEERLPIVNVDWHEARAFCRWAGGDLPTEAQWEYAARAGNPNSRYGKVADIAWIADTAGSTRVDASTLLSRDAAAFLGRLATNGNTFHPVGLLPANSVGLHDTLGNVWEWTADWYDENYYKRYVRFDPPGPESGETKVLRGGSWVNAPVDVRSSTRGKRPPAMRSIDTGFRCKW